MLKRIKALIMSALVLVCGTSCTKNDSKSEEVTVTNPQLEVTFFDVGKADSIILCSKNSTVIIDCGEKGDGKEIISFLEEKNISTVDYLILTHYDKDHIGGAAKVIKSMEIKNILAPDYEESSEEMEKYQKAVSDKGLTPQLLTSDMSFELDGISYKVNAPDQTDYGENNDNDFSLITKVVHGDNVFLFTGDAMEARLEEVMDIGTCKMLKVPYHGRKLDNLDQFIDKVQPEYAVVCTSQDEFAGSVQKLLNKKEITYYSTCFNGRITALSDGKNIAFTTEKG